MWDYSRDKINSLEYRIKQKQDECSVKPVSRKITMVYDDDGGFEK